MAELKPTIIPGQDWPPTEADAYRVSEYQKHRDIVDGNHIVALGDKDELDRYGVYVTCNLAGLIVRRSTDLLFGEELTLQFEDDAPEEKTEKVLDWWYDNDLQKTLYEGALDGASLGDAVYLPQRDIEGLVTIQPAQVQTWFPVLDPDNQRIVYKHVFAWEREWKPPTGGKLTFLKMRIHNKGFIENQLWELKGGKLTKEYTKGSQPWKDLWGDALAIEETGIDDDFLVVHVPNYRAARDYFGRPDCFGQESMFSVLNARYSQLDFLLANHADPILTNVPKGLANPQTGELDKKHLAYVEASGDPDEKELKYVEWNGSPAESLAFIEEVTNKILLMSETDKALLGLDTGGGPTSGRALKFALMATLAKVNRKRQYYTQAIPKMVELAQRLWGEKDPVFPTILWPDGLPQDTQELLEEMTARLADGTISKKEAVKRLDNVDDQVAEKMLDEIGEEEDNNAEALTQAVQGRPKPKMNPVGVTEEEMGGTLEAE